MIVGELRSVFEVLKSTEARFGSELFGEDELLVFAFVEEFDAGDVVAGEATDVTVVLLLEFSRAVFEFSSFCFSSFI